MLPWISYWYSFANQDSMPYLLVIKPNIFLKSDLVMGLQDVIYELFYNQKYIMGAAKLHLMRKYKSPKNRAFIFCVCLSAQQFMVMLVYCCHKLSTALILTSILAEAGKFKDSRNHSVYRGYFRSCTHFCSHVKDLSRALLEEKIVFINSKLLCSFMISNTTSIRRYSTLPDNFWMHVNPLLVR